MKGQMGVPPIIVAAQAKKNAHNKVAESFYFFRRNSSFDYEYLNWLNKENFICINGRWRFPFLLLN